MKSVLFLTTAALAMGVFAGTALAQTEPALSAAPSAPASAPINPTAPSASDSAQPASAIARDSNAPLGSSANPIPQNSPTPMNEASTLVAGDPTVVSNGPVPDTKANRAKYGQPLSATGRASRPAGN